MLKGQNSCKSERGSLHNSIRCIDNPVKTESLWEKIRQNENFVEIENIKSDSRIMDDANSDKCDACIQTNMPAFKQICLHSKYLIHQVQKLIKDTC